MLFATTSKLGICREIIDLCRERGNIRIGNKTGEVYLIRLFPDKPPSRVAEFFSTESLLKKSSETFANIRL